MEIVIMQRIKILSTVCCLYANYGFHTLKILYKQRFWICELGLAEMLLHSSVIQQNWVLNKSFLFALVSSPPPKKKLSTFLRKKKNHPKCLKIEKFWFFKTWNGFDWVSLLYLREFTIQAITLVGPFPAKCLTILWLTLNAIHSFTASWSFLYPFSPVASVGGFHLSESYGKTWLGRLHVLNPI